MFAGKVHDLRHFGFRNLVGIDPALADPVLVDMHHDSLGGFVVLVEEVLEHVDDEFHGRIVVVEEHDLVERRVLLLRLDALFDDPVGFVLVVGHL